VPRLTRAEAGQIEGWPEFQVNLEFNRPSPQLCLGKRESLSDAKENLLRKEKHSNSWRNTRKFDVLSMLAPV
jgi:hypothetical protein